MKVDACKQNDGSKKITIEFDTKDNTESIFASMLIDKFLELPMIFENKDCGNVAFDLFKSMNNV